LDAEIKMPFLYVVKVEPSQIIVRRDDWLDEWAAMRGTRNAGGLVDELLDAERAAHRFFLLAPKIPMFDDHERDYAPARPLTQRRMLSAEVKERVVSEYAKCEEAGTGELCERFGISQSTLYRLVHRAGVTTRNSPVPVEEQARIVEAYEQGGVSLSELADRFDHHDGTIRSILLAHNISVQRKARKCRNV
jgi:transposase-like protein